MTAPTPDYSADVARQVTTEWDRRVGALPTARQRIAAGEYAVTWMQLMVDLDVPVTADTVRAILAAAVAEAVAS